METSTGLARLTDLPTHAYSSTFHSRLGPERWSGPQATDVLTSLGSRKDLKTLFIICPSFISDCLETLEEIDTEARELVAAMRPDITLITVPCLNAHPALVEFFARAVTALAQATATETDMPPAH